MKVRLSKEEYWPVFMIAEDDARISEYCQYIEMTEELREKLSNTNREFVLAQNLASELWLDQVDLVKTEG